MLKLTPELVYIKGKKGLAAGIPTTKTKRVIHKQKAKRPAGIKGQLARMLKSPTRQIDTIAMKRARKNVKKKNN